MLKPGLVFPFVKLLLFLCPLLLAVASVSSRAADATAKFRATLVEAILSEDVDKQVELVNQLVDAEDELIARGLTAWRASELYVHSPASGAKAPFLLDVQPGVVGDSKGIRLFDGTPVLDPTGKPLTFNASSLTPVDNSSKL